MNIKTTIIYLVIRKHALMKKTPLKANNLKVILTPIIFQNVNIIVTVYSLIRIQRKLPEQSLFVERVF